MCEIVENGQRWDEQRAVSYQAPRQVEAKETAQQSTGIFRWKRNMMWRLREPRNESVICVIGQYDITRLRFWMYGEISVFAFE